MLPVIEIFTFFAGFVAAEGSFNRSRNRFRFAIALGSKDGRMCELMRQILGVGNIVTSPRRQPHFDDETIFAVNSARDLVQVVIPFMDLFLPASKKRDQYSEWRRQLLEFWEHDARRRRPCTIDGCEQPQRGKGACRRHYYQAYHR